MELIKLVVEEMRKGRGAIHAKDGGRGGRLEEARKRVEDMEKLGEAAWSGKQEEEDSGRQERKIYGGAGWVPKMKIVITLRAIISLME